jgi:hypothetical protein
MEQEDEEDHIDEEEGNGDNCFIYENWRGKCFLIDEKFAKAFREALVEEGEKLEDVAHLTPKHIFDAYDCMEPWERHFQLEEMWEMPEAKTDR